MKMVIIKFHCLDPETAETLKELILLQANKWSRLQYLASDPEYTTSPFGKDEWHEHTQTPGLWWADYGKIYEHLGEHGREIADQMFGPGLYQGILLDTPLSLDYPDARLEIIEVEDPIADGYLAAPVIEL